MKNWTITRRKFLKTSALTAGATALGTFPSFGKEMKKALRFGVVTDTHYADREPQGKRYYRESKTKLQECVGLMNEQNVDFLIHLGDFKDQAKDPQEQQTIHYLQALEKVFAQFKGKRFHVLGNHDMDSISKSQFQGNIKNSGIPKEKTYYSFDHKHWHFVVLDANFTSEGKAYDHGNYDWTDANIPQEQLDWLQKDLSKTKFPVIVFCHQLLQEEGNYTVKNAAAVRAVLEASGKVQAVFQGHIHKEKHAEIQGIHYSTFLAVVDGEGKENNSYAIVEPQQEGIRITGYRKASHQVLERGK
ncbi:metallophosphoesterase [Rapidithrix thailandica]|uniref:Metallophosphoesterase n=1 Tax=Rapidithrix thailandica TaxID=413964 RepID=A0AAW9S2D1_9BACT